MKSISYIQNIRIAATRFLGLSVLGGFSLACAFSQGTISGVVLDGTGAPAASATVLYNNVPHLSSSGRSYLENEIRSAVAADAGGHFALSGLPFGTYYVCAAGRMKTDLRSCDWNLPLATVELSPASPGTTLELHLGIGVRVLMSVYDQHNRIAEIDPSRIRGAFKGNFKLGVSVGSWYTPATLLSNVDGVRTYEAVVPMNERARVLLWTTLVGNFGDRRQDEAGIIAFPIAVGNADTTLSLGVVN